MTILRLQKIYETPHEKKINDVLIDTQTRLKIATQITKFEILGLQDLVNILEKLNPNDNIFWSCYKSPDWTGFIYWSMQAEILGLMLLRREKNKATNLRTDGSQPIANK
jgi:hypothetical protein